MFVVRAFFRGWLQAFRFPGLWSLKWLIHLIMTSLVALPIATILWSHPSPAAHDPSFSLSGLWVLWLQSWPALKVSALPMALALGVVLAADGFVSGGIFRTLCTGQRTPWSEFWANCGRFFFSILGVTLLSGIFFVLVVVIPSLFLYLGIEPFKAWADGGVLSTVLDGLWMLIVLFLVSLGARVTDYARIMVCGPHEREVFRSFGHAISFVARYQGGTLLLWLFFVTLSGLFFWSMVWSDDLARLIPIQAVAVHLIFGQLLVLLRIGSRLASWSAFLDYASAVGSRDETNEVDVATLPSVTPQRAES